MGWKSSGNCVFAWNTVKSPTAETNRQWLMRCKPAGDDDDVRRHRTGVQEKPKLRCKGFGSERGRPNHPPCIRAGSAVIEVVEGCRSSHSSRRWRKSHHVAKGCKDWRGTCVCEPQWDNTKGTFCRRMDDIRKTQESFARKAQTQPEHRFGDLYHLICREDWLRNALEKVLSNPGSRTAGIDKISRRDFKEEEQKTAFIQALRAELKDGTYRPQPVKRRWIPKANGKQRPLGIPTLKDRVVQMALKLLLEPIWESDFLDCSNGFRPGRRTMDSIRVCRSRITTQNKYPLGCGRRY